MKTTRDPCHRAGRSGATAQGRRHRRAPPRSEKKEGSVLNVFSHGLLVLWAFMVVMPLLWAVMTSFKDDSADLQLALGAARQAALRQLGAGLDRRQHERLLPQHRSGRVAGSLIGTLLLGSMAAYVLARFDFPGNRFIYFLFIGGMSFPIMLALVPLFYVVNNIGLLNTDPRPDPRLHRLLAAVHGLLPDRRSSARCRPRWRRRPSSTAPRTPGRSSRSCCRWPSPA